MRRSPCCMTTLPESTACPWMLYSTLSPVISVLVVAGSGRGAAGLGNCRTCDSLTDVGQPHSSACTGDCASNGRSTSPLIAALSEVSGTVAHYTYTNARARPAPDLDSDLADTRPGMAHRS